MLESSLSKSHLNRDGVKRRRGDAETRSNVRRVAPSPRHRVVLSPRLYFPFVADFDAR